MVDISTVLHASISTEGVSLIGNDVTVFVVEVNGDVILDVTNESRDDSVLFDSRLDDEDCVSLTDDGVSEVILDVDAEVIFDFTNENKED